MLVGIHTDIYGRFNDSLKIYEIILEKNGIDFIRLSIGQLDFWEKVSKVDLFIYKWTQFDTQKQMAQTILPIVEKELSINTYPNNNTCWHYDDKIREYYLLNANGFPIIESWVFWDKKLALEWLEKAKLPVIFKLKSGAGSANVILVNKKTKAKKLINKMFGAGLITNKLNFWESVRYLDFNLKKTIHHLGGNFLRKLRDEDILLYWQLQKNYVLFQKFLANNNFDTRVTVIGKRAFAFRRLNRENDYRASGSGRLIYDIEKIDLNMIKIALEISEKMNFQSMAYDFLYDENLRPQICEISYTYIDSFLKDCPGYWDSDLNWHEGHFWPQYFHLMDTLNLPNLKQPEIEL